MPSTKTRSATATSTKVGYALVSTAVVAAGFMVFLNDPPFSPPPEPTCSDEMRAADKCTSEPTPPCSTTNPSAPCEPGSQPPTNTPPTSGATPLANTNSSSGGGSGGSVQNPTQPPVNSGPTGAAAGNLPTLPDLVVNSLAGARKSDGRVFYSVTVKNIGLANITTSRNNPGLPFSSRLSFYLVDTTGNQTLLANFPIAWLTVGSSQTFDGYLEPASFASRFVKLLAEADGLDDVTESDEANNSLAKLIQ